MESFDIKKYLDIAFRRKYWIIILFLLTVLAGLSYILTVSKIYESKALILVQPQRVPQEFVRSVASQNLDFTLATIIRQVTSRANLEEIVRRYRLYNEPVNTMTMEEKVKLMVNMININIERAEERKSRHGVVWPSSLTISFRGKEPKKVMSVTNALASSVIAENLQIRESTVIGTTAFLSEELENIERRISDKEEEIKRYKEKYMGVLPEQLQTNIGTLDRLRAQLDRYDDELRDQESRKLVVQQQLEVANSQNDELNEIRAELELYESRYTENHPDVIRLRRMISKIEVDRQGKSAPNKSAHRASQLSRDVQGLRHQLQDIELRIESLKANIDETKHQIILYQKRVEEAPKREQEHLSLRRDYENLKDIYNSLLEKKLESDIAVSMERQQKGERFLLLDAATLPIKPIKPDVRVVAMLTLVLGLALGAGFAYTIELMDTSYRTPEELEKELQIPVLVSMPLRHTKKELIIQRTKGIMKAASVAVGFVICAIGIALATKGMDTTLDFAKNLRDKTMITFSPTETSSLSDESQNPPVK